MFNSFSLLESSVSYRDTAAPDNTDLDLLAEMSENMRTSFTPLEELCRDVNAAQSASKQVQQIFHEVIDSLDDLPDAVGEEYRRRQECSSENKKELNELRESIKEAKSDQITNEAKVESQLRRYNAKHTGRQLSEKLASKITEVNELSSSCLRGLNVLQTRN